MLNTHTEITYLTCTMVNPNSLPSNANIHKRFNFFSEVKSTAQIYSHAEAIKLPLANIRNEMH